MYQIELTEKEYDALGWLTDRGYFPKETWRELTPTDQANGECAVYIIPESAAWAILEQREEDPHSLFACAGGSLFEKLLALEQSIV